MRQIEVWQDWLWDGSYGDVDGRGVIWVLMLDIQALPAVSGVGEGEVSQSVRFGVV